MMRVPPLWILVALAVGALILRSRSSTTASQIPAPDSRGAAVPYTPPAPTFKAEWAGSDLYRQAGTVLPSGAARDLIR